MMSSHLALPRQGHLEQVLIIFLYLKNKHNAEIVYDPSDPCLDESKFKKQDSASSEFGHLEGKEEIPENAPEPRGVGFVIHSKIDADHASDTVLRRSRTGMVIWLNSSLAHWWSKKQNSVTRSSKHYQPRLNFEEEVKLNCIPCRVRSSCNGRMSHWSCPE